MAEQKKPVKQQESKPVMDKDFRHIVRVANTDLKGEKKLFMALKKIKGVSFMFSNFICFSSKINPNKLAGNLTDEDVKVLEDIIRNPMKYDCPEWLLNRRNDYETGQDMHLITTDLNLTIDADIKRMKKVKSYKGLRHTWGLPVRGQRTKSNFRRNKGKVSLSVKKQVAKKK